MPSKSPAQHRFMEAIAHGMKPRKGGPSKAVAQDFVDADKQVSEFHKDVAARSKKVRSRRRRG